MGVDTDIHHSIRNLRVEGGLRAEFGNGGALLIVGSTKLDGIDTDGKEGVAKGVDDIGAVAHLFGVEVSRFVV